MVLANPSGATAVPNAGNGQPGSSPAPTAGPAWSAADGFRIRSAPPGEPDERHFVPAERPARTPAP